DVALRITPAVGRRPEGFDEADVLVEHEGAWVRLQDLGRDTDRVEGFVEIESGLKRPPGRRHRYSFSHPSTPLDRFAGVVWLLIRYSRAPSFSPRSTSSRSP